MTEGDTHPAAQEEPLKRYDLVTNYRCGSSIEEMERSDDGEWMRYEDHEALVTHLTQELSDLKAEHQCCLDGDEAWAAKWKAAAIKASDQLTTLHREQAALVEKWRKDADESDSFTDNDQGEAPPQNVTHARGMSTAFTVCADELTALLPVSLSQEPIDP